jgi:DNA-binding NarL/FixJ family response regulator
MVGGGMIRVAVIDDHPVFRDGTAALLGREPNIKVVALGSSLAEARSILEAEDPPDVLILDVRLGDENALTLLGRHDRTAVIIFSAFDYPQYRSVALRAGAAGYVSKSVDTGQLIEAVQAAAAGKLVFDRRHDAPLIAFTPRETEVLRLVADGLSNDEISTELGVTAKTVEGHLGRIFERTDVQSRTELATRAIREGWLDLPRITIGTDR